MSNIKLGGHRCEGHTEKDGYGEAIDAAFELEDGTLWVSNSEYGSQVSFCPYCGFKALVPAVSKL